MKFRHLSSRLLPPALAWRLDRARREREEMAKFRELYDHFLQPGDLCFDIGANLGNRTRCFREMDCRVVAVEPQADCQKRLHAQFADDPDVTLVQAVCAATPGRATLKISPDHVLSTICDEFIESTQASGRFAASSWTREVDVEATTLDGLIDRFGMPAFVKIDVEGAEPQVLAGLSHPVPALSIEWTPELSHNTLACIERIEQLGGYEYDVSWAETMRMSSRGWRAADAMRRLIDEFAGETFLFGDIYARRLQR